jgi:hypothetical protein
MNVHHHDETVPDTFLPLSPGTSESIRLKIVSTVADNGHTTRG